MSPATGGQGEPDRHVCPHCGAPMAELKCKLRCACGYFEDCGDGLTPPPMARSAGRRPG